MIDLSRYRPADHDTRPAVHAGTARAYSSSMVNLEALDRAGYGASQAATRARQAARRERVARSSAGVSCPCEQCGREWCLAGDYLGPSCRGARTQAAKGARP
jgi:hypothetical protein